MAVMNMMMAKALMTGSQEEESALMMRRMLCRRPKSRTTRNARTIRSIDNPCSDAHTHQFRMRKPRTM
eukprot:3576463-Rhodomonas_salina.3